MAAVPLDWKLAQSFGEKHQEDLVQGDIVSALEFNDDGTLLAIGDRGGRIKVLQRNVVAVDRAASAGASARLSSAGMGASKDSAWFRRAGTPTPPPVCDQPAAAVNYRELCEFKSHDPEFDYLKSLEIEEKINCISWLKRSSRSMSLLTTNDKTIKLWKVKSRDSLPSKPALMRRPSADSLFPTPSSAVASTPSFARRVYANGHAYHINSISTSSDCEHFISADDLRLNLWNFEVSDTAFNVVDIKPSNMEDLTEVITSACFHPEACSVFAWANSRGAIRLSDMRGQALCDSRAKVFQEADDPSRRSFFSEIISSISDVKFSSDGRYLLSRDYMTLKLWDCHMESAPVKMIHVHEQLRPRLCDLYETDSIFDKFQCCFSGDGSNFASGSYQSLFHVYDRNSKSDVCVEANVTGAKKKPLSKISKFPGRSRSGSADVTITDFERKCTQIVWNPAHQEIAVACQNNVLVYAGAPA